MSSEWREQREQREQRETTSFIRPTNHLLDSFSLCSLRSLASLASLARHPKTQKNRPLIRAQRGRTYRARLTKSLNRETQENREKRPHSSDPRIIHSTPFLSVLSILSHLLRHSKNTKKTGRQSARSAAADPTHIPRTSDQIIKQREQRERRETTPVHNRPKYIHTYPVRPLFSPFSLFSPTSGALPPPALSASST